jgi:hypothetical protein
MGQNRIKGGGVVKNRRKSSDIIYVRSLGIHTKYIPKVPKINQILQSYQYFSLDDDYQEQEKRP